MALANRPGGRVSVRPFLLRSMARPRQPPCDIAVEAEAEDAGREDGAALPPSPRPEGTASGQRGLRVSPGKRRPLIDETNRVRLVKVS